MSPLIAMLNPKTSSDRFIVSRLEGVSIATRIFEHLLKQILAMELKPFQELSEARLAEEFGVSRSPVREALARLARRGLVEIYPQRGTVVSPLSITLIEKSRFIREALERPLARLAAQMITPSQVALLEREIALQKTFAELGDVDSFLKSDDRMHELIAEAAGYASIWDDVHEAKFHMDRVRHISLLSKARMADLIVEHQEIIQHLRTHACDLAEASVTQHLTSVGDDIAAIARQFPQYFPETS
jgi:GntR family transcriptional regulator, rspAB operon transcriptional repressor